MELKRDMSVACDRWTDIIFYSTLGLIAYLTVVVITNLNRETAAVLSQNQINYKTYEYCLPRNEVEVTHIAKTKDGYICSTTRMMGGTTVITRERLTFKKEI